ncbi:Dipeptidyl-peptidase III [Histomonas meleagridis]|uniref:Dipeptidyl-peptidase III n=1 Tax=Histomonas meleagridis TaxID=135588 RepID=UPI00355AA675|nr:Dipeptidyl-peptidase III [Histomonas meleagridis]KAH0805308.1 Dipeptidyl-peptidase III [Histomonas meleagridis]
MSVEPRFLVGTEFHVGDLRVKEVLDGLTPQERQYATYLTLAGWAGYPILADQVSRSTLAISNFLSEFVLTYPKDKLVAATSEKGTPLFYLLEYASSFFYNASEYLGFGDIKMIPRITKEQLTELVSDYPKLKELLNACVDSIYDASPQVLHIGYNPGGVTSYYDPPEFSKDEVKAIDSILSQQKVRVENTKIIRHSDKYEVSVASIDESEPITVGQYNNLPIVITHGRHSSILKKVVHWLELAKSVAPRENEKEMLTSLISHYTTGDVLQHETYSIQWVHDIDPNVETYQGFIESYRDPSGVRCEYEAFIAAVNHKESESLHEYVRNSQTILSLLPYPKEYERKTFTPPSYNAIDILSFCTTGMPIGINIPNYDSVRLKEGFKNVSLTNVMNASIANRNNFPFLTESEKDIVVKYAGIANTIHVASHELYGHGSAALFYKEDVVGKNIPDLINPKKTVETYYPEGVSFDSAFGSHASSYEECRAETTALFLIFKPEVQKIFGVSESDFTNVTYTDILLLLHNGIKTLTCYSPEVAEWKQAHARARFAILRACIMWSNGAVVMHQKENNEYELVVNIDKLDNIMEALERLLKYLNYYKTTYQVEAGVEFYRSLTAIDSFWLDVRSQSVKKTQPRMVVCGAVVKKDEGGNYMLDQVTSEKPTTYDVAYSIAENIKMALDC